MALIMHFPPFWGDSHFGISRGEQPKERQGMLRKGVVKVIEVGQTGKTE
jgi:hypothetical protein